MTDAEGDADTDTGAATETAPSGVRARYEETDAERRLTVEHEGQSAVVAQNRDGYAMLTVRQGLEGDELERYYGFDMALDHAAELLGVARHDLPVPDPAEDMGM